MMKQQFFRVGCAAVSVSLAAGLLASCSVLPQPSAPAASHPEQDAPKDYDASSLKDGHLRILYNYNATGGNTILCGDTVLRQSPLTETSFLVTDTITGETNYYFCEWSDSSTASGRCGGLFDASGKEVFSTDRSYDVRLSGGLLLLTTSSGFAYSPVHSHAAGDVRVIDLATGQDLPVPENAYSCVAAGDRLAFGIYAPGDAVSDEENDDLYQYSAVQVQEKDGTVVYQNPHATVGSISGSYGDSFTPTDWLEIDTYSDDGVTIEQTSLLNAMTGEELSGYTSYLNNGVACFRQEDGSYALVDLVSAENSATLCTFDAPVSAYAPGVAVLNRSDTGNDYELHDLATGETQPLYDFSLGSDGTFATYATDGTLRVYDSATGKVLTDTVVEPVENLQRTDFYNEDGGWVWLRQYDNDDYKVTSSTVCGPNGTNKELDIDALRSAYGDSCYLWPIAAANGQLYFSLSYKGPGSSWLYDVLDSDGKAVVRGLGACTGYYSSSANPLPEGVFVARKGFEYGWMDTDGNWIYCQSIFDSTGDDTENMYY